MAESNDNTLRIETDSLEVTLTGTAGDVARAYDALRSLLVERFESTLQSDAGSPEEGYGLGDDGTAPLHRASNEQDTPPPEYSAAVRSVTENLSPDDEPAVLQLVLLRESHSKAHLIDRAELANSSLLGGVLAPSQLRRIYADESLEERLAEELELGTTVWRELTAEGRTRVEREAAAAEQKASREESDQT